MPYRFLRSESLKAGVRRILKEQVAKAHVQLASAKDRTVAVHEARKSIKRIRALLRLVRPALERAIYRRENVRYRDIGRCLSGTRDRAVMLETVSKLSGGSAAHVEFALAKVRKVLAEAIESEGLSEDQAAMRDAICRLDDAKASLSSISPKFSGFEVIRFGLEKSYRRGQVTLARLDDEQGDAPFHDWRKLVQAHWRHMAVLSEAWPSYFEVRVKLAKEISQQVGKHNDLAVLDAFVGGLDENTISRSDTGLLHAVIANKKARLRAQACASGALLFADDAAALSEIVSRYWTIARDQSKRGEHPKAEPDRAIGHKVVPITQRHMKR